MHPDPFSDPGDDAREPDCSLPPAEPGPSAEAAPAQQGLFMCLPAGSLDTDQFAQSGPAADMPPDPLLAMIIDTITGQDGKGLAGLSDDQLIGVIAAVRRLESRATWYLMAAVREFAARRADEPCGAEFAADQSSYHPVTHLRRSAISASPSSPSRLTGRPSSSASAPTPGGRADPAAAASGATC